VMCITIDRPGRRNALTAPMYRDICEALDRAAEDDAVRVVLVSGSATCFTAGNDLDEFLEHPPMSPDAPVTRFLTALVDAPKPLIAAVEGAAIGVGTTMLLHFDFVIAGAGSAFQLPFVDLGLCPEAGSTVLLPSLVGHRRSAELLILGTPFDAPQAVELGIANQVVPAGTSRERARQIAARIAALPPDAVQTTKALLRRPQRESLAVGMAAESEQFRRLLVGPEAIAAISAKLHPRA